MATDTQNPAVEIKRIQTDMERIQKALFDVGMASLGSTVGNWSVQLDKVHKHLTAADPFTKHLPDVLK